LKVITEPVDVDVVLRVKVRYSGGLNVVEFSVLDSPGVVGEVASEKLQASSPRTKAHIATANTRFV
jgi:hypothetical protein